MRVAADVTTLSEGVPGADAARDGESRCRRDDAVGGCGGRRRGARNRELSPT
jgi:hypothetical protein